MSEHKTPLQKAKDLCGGAAGLADKLNEINPSRPLTRQAVHQWVQVPAVRAVDVEKASGVPRYELRPDVFGKPERVA